jgi:hypothetical protein
MFVIGYFFLIRLNHYDIPKPVLQDNLHSAKRNSEVTDCLVIYQRNSPPDASPLPTNCCAICPTIEQCVGWCSKAGFAQASDISDERKLSFCGTERLCAILYISVRIYVFEEGANDDQAATVGAAGSNTVSFLMKP